MRQDNGAWVGSCKIYPFPGANHVILHGYEIRPEFQGKGYAAQLSAELEQVVEDMEVSRKFAFVPKKNKAQAKRMTPLGWTDLGHGYWFKEVG
jgi:RimJ/RimL family protein N-acetyltransferase